MSSHRSDPSLLTLPAPLVSDQVAEYAAVWEAFGTLGQPVPHRAEWGVWAAGRGPHLLLLVPLREPDVAGAVGVVQRSLAGLDGLELHPAHFLHLSVQSLGFLARPGQPAREGELELRALEALVEPLAARLARVPAFDVDLGGANAFFSSVFLEVHSGGSLLGLRSAVRSTAGPTLASIDPHPGFLFHLTLGYFGPQAAAGAARAALAPLRHRRVARLRVDRVDLVAVATDQREAYPVLEPVACFRLAD